MDLEREEARMLEATRTVLEPKSGDAARIEVALSAALAAGIETPVLDDAGGSSAKLWLAKGLVPLALVAGGGVVGYELGFRAGKAAVMSPPAPVLVVQAAPTGPSPMALDEPARDEHAVTAAIDPPNAVPRRPAAMTTAPAVDANEGPGLDAETRLLARVERALRDDNPRLALGLLGELERTVPGGQLQEERAAARTMAACELDPDASSAQTSAFTKRYPTSAYLGRIQATCSGSPEAAKE